MKATLDALLRYALEKELIQPGDETYVYNRLLEILRLDEAEEGPAAEPTLEGILQTLTDDAVRCMQAPPSRLPIGIIASAATPTIFDGTGSKKT